ncbi:hypothetical protein NMG60_11006573 [Bertholletia excelsa]
MPGREGERRIRCRHMWSVPAPTTSSVAASDSTVVITPDSFSKDGRKVCVGDCALFKAPQDTPPFIGLIRRLIPGEEENLILSVNWLYRPADVKLGKGTLAEAAPNEVFYSFHKDETPASSILHPCKVAFLRKGVELPSGISSFVCRRVYDVENKCLWWLTDKDYINERQEEVDRLLERTSLEMHGAVQSGGRSPKRLSGPAGTQLPRSGSESSRNSSSSLPSQVKGKKRDRTDQGFDLVKRERVLRADDIESGQSGPEHILKSEIAKITNKGGLVDFEGVEKLVQLMQPNSTERKIDLACRIMLVDVIALTERLDCLRWFVQLKGLPVLDEWLQEAHKGKIGDGSSPKENDKSVEEFLLVLLCALDKLPVNLHALKSCNVGKSVNNLRSHKNSEIQKKARSLVDTWKKGVEAEMNIMDAKTGSNHGNSWPSKSMLSEVSHVGNRRNGGSSEVSVKSSTVQSSAAKTSSTKHGSGEAVVKVMSPSQGSTKATASVSSAGGASGRDPNSATLASGGSSDLPLSTIKEEKSSSSSQSQNNSQSCSSDHAKTGSSCREDVRSSAGSVSIGKISGSGLRHRKLNNGLQGSAVSAVQKETSLGKFTSLSRNLASENVLSTKGTHEKVAEAPLVDHGNSPKLIVRLANTARGLAPSANGSSFDDISVTLSKASPPAESEKLDHHDRKAKGKSDAFQTSSTSNNNMDLCKGTDGLVGSDKCGAASPGALCNERCRIADDGDKLIAASKGTGLPTGFALKTGKSYDASFNSMNALVESCVKFSQARTTASGGDDIGMNLLASVATGEMSRCDVSLSGSPARNSPIPEESFSGNDVKSRHPYEDTAQSEGPTNDRPNCSGMQQCENSVDSLCGRNGSSQDAVPISTNFAEGSKVSSIHCQENRGECSGKLNSSNAALQQNECGSHLQCDSHPGQEKSLVAISTENAKKAGNTEIEGAAKFHEQRRPGAAGLVINNASPSKLNSRSPLPDEGMVVNHGDEKINEGSVLFPEEAAIVKVVNEVKEESPSCSSSELDKEDSNHKESGCGKSSEKKLTVTAKIEQGPECGKDEGTVLPPSSHSVSSLEVKTEMAIDGKAVSQTEQSEKQNIDFGETIVDQIDKCSEKSEVKGVLACDFDTQEDPRRIRVQQTEECMKSSVGKLDVAEDVGRIKCASDMNAASGSEAGSDVVVKLDFDLNEGFPVDDGCQGELAKSSLPGTMSTAPLPCPLHCPLSSTSASIPASITVASAAKGSFFPPENPLRSKGELGWKGSAATSAFRPAEPRKTPEMPLSENVLPSVDDGTGKEGRLPLDIDLNVPDQRVIEDVASLNSSRVMCLEPRDRQGGGLDLDLNRVDETPDVGQFSVVNSIKVEVPQLSNRSLLSGGASNTELNASRDFDLNSGPDPDEGVAEPTVRAKSNVPFISPFPGLRMNTMDQGNFSSWFPPSNSYSAIAIPSVLPGRGEQNCPIANGSHRILGAPGSSSFVHELYRGPVLSSSPAVPFPPTGPFQYSGFPFETNFPLPSSSYSSGSTAYVESSSGGPICFPSMPPHLVGPAGVASSHFPRPYFMSLPGGTSNPGPESRKCVAPALDLNGPGGPDAERRDERLPSALRQFPVPVSQAPADEQIKLCQMAGGVLKRREPDSGWDADRISYKQPSWQ